MTAWMIRNDGKETGVTAHPYGNPNLSEIEETLAAGEWLYGNTKHASLQKLVVLLFASWAYGAVGSIKQAEIESYLNKLPYKVVGSGFTDAIFPKLLSAPVYEADGLNRLVTAELNQEFLRARYGGMYNTKPGNRDMYFRTSSVCFDWLKIIRDFTAERQNDIDTVTVIRDFESTGAEDRYLNCGGIAVNRLATADFLAIADCQTALPSNPLLSRGMALNESFPPRNRLRLAGKISRLCFEESERFYTRGIRE